MALPPSGETKVSFCWICYAISDDQIFDLLGSRKRMLLWEDLLFIISTDVSELICSLARSSNPVRVVFAISRNLA